MTSNPQARTPPPQTQSHQPGNTGKAGEYGLEAATPEPGQTSKSPSPYARASTVAERISTEKTGGPAQPGVNAVGGDLTRVRADAEDAPLFVRNQFRHYKTLLAIGAGRQLLVAAGITPDDDDPGVFFGATPDAQTLDGFVEAISKHRHYSREGSAAWRVT